MMEILPYPAPLTEWALAIRIMADWRISRGIADPRFIEAEAAKTYFARVVVVDD
jgi:hypothetical protein